VGLSPLLPLLPLLPLWLFATIFRRAIVTPSRNIRFELAVQAHVLHVTEGQRCAERVRVPLVCSYGARGRLTQGTGALSTGHATPSAPGRHHTRSVLFSTPHVYCCYTAIPQWVRVFMLELSALTRVCVLCRDGRQGCFGDRGHGGGEEWCGDRVVPTRLQPSSGEGTTSAPHKPYPYSLSISLSVLT
jgi:hypothetical protein